MRRLADEVERDIRKRQIDFDRRGMTAPFGKTLAKNERVVTEAQRVGGEGLGHQMCLMWLGME
jgi:hypothetical protein